MVTIGGMAGRLSEWLRRLMPAGERLDRLVDGLAREFGGSAAPISAGAVREVETAVQAHARHLELNFDAASAAPADDPSGPAPAWPPPDPAAVRAIAGGVSSVRRLPAGVCVIAVDSLESFADAKPFLDNAFGLAHGASRIVLDLRANGGGEPATVAAIAGLVLGGPARHLSDVVYRDRRRPWWTVDSAEATWDATVLVSERTYSSGEALAYHLQARGVPVVGARTRGAADHVLPVRLVPQVLALVPEATVVDAVTGTNWEQTGVVPDVACPSADALEAVRAVT